MAIGDPGLDGEDVHERHRHAIRQEQAAPSRRATEEPRRFARVTARAAASRAAPARGHPAADAAEPTQARHARGRTQPMTATLPRREAARRRSPAAVLLPATLSAQPVASARRSSRSASPPSCPARPRSSACPRAAPARCWSNRSTRAGGIAGVPVRAYLRRRGAGHRPPGRRVPPPRAVRGRARDVPVDLVGLLPRLHAAVATS